MKKHLILLAAALSCGLYSFAQVSFGLKAGFSAANVSNRSTASGTEVKADTKLRPAFHAGVIVDIPLADYCSFQPGILYSSKGWKYKSTGITLSTRLNYLEVPLNLLYKGKVGKGKFFGGFGPYIAYGIAGKIRAKSESSGLTTEIDVKFKNVSTEAASQAYVKPFDAGANIIAGYETDMGLLFSANFSLGLVNTSPYRYEKEQNYYFGVSVGYLFKKK